jgi:ubiquinone/menaquinone biosynthesis C-methylase UbiE
MEKEKSVVKKYYETFGWQKTTRGLYKDDLLFSGQRKSEIFFAHLNLSILRRHFKHKGVFFLDVGCGAAPSTVLAQGFNYHVCTDFSKAGLMETKRKVVNGMFLMADLNHLPFRAFVFDGAVAMHILYHLPRDCQAKAIDELARITAKGGKCFIAYSNLEGFSRLLSFLPQKLTRLARCARRLKLKNEEPRALHTSDKPPLYAYYFSLEYFKNRPSSGYRLRFGTAHLLGGASRSIVPNGIAGYLVLSFVLFIERFFSGPVAKYSVHPAIVVEKC